MEDYKKKYEEARERMKSWAKGEHPEYFTEAHKAAEFIFPELKESEDERIKRCISDVVRKYGREFTTGTVTKEKMLAWLEKQSEQNPIDYPVAHAEMEPERWKQACKAACCDRNYRSHHGLTETRDDYFVDGVHWADEHPKQNPADKVEPKFKVGDWITDGEYTWKVTDIKPLDYILQSQNGDTADDTISYVDEYLRLWTIQDAKDGDVLVDEDDNIGIFQECKDIYWDSYIYLGCDGKLRGFCMGGAHIQNDTKPATKEQRDILFQKIKEAGYEWDTKKKELKNIEQKPTWSEEDEKMLHNTLSTIRYALSIPIDKEDDLCFVGSSIISWLKSLKERMKGGEK